MRHHLHPVAAFLLFFLGILLAPYILAALAIIVVAWLVCFVIAAFLRLFDL